jgi:hypothetical protein
MGIVVYALCALASLVCTLLLFRGYRHSGRRLLFWSALCFGCFCLNNLVLIVDVRMLPERDLSVIRSIPSLLGIALLIYGLVWDSAE